MHVEELKFFGKGINSDFLYVAFTTEEVLVRSDLGR